MSSEAALRRPTFPAHVLAPAPARARFEQRTHCVVCEGEAFDDVWTGSFDDPSVQEFLGQFHYAGNVASALTGAHFRLVRCRSCHMMFHQNVLVPEWLGRLYGEWIDSEQIERFEARVSPSGRSRARFERGRQFCKHILRLHQLLPPDRSVYTVLDFGCGDGHFLNMASSFGYEAYGVDFSVTRVGRLKDRSVTVAPSLDALNEVGPARFDAITLFETLEHLTNPAALLKQLHARLSPHGVLIVEVPNSDGVSVPQDLREFHAVQPLEHINAFTPATLEALCTRCGFARIRKPAAHVTTEATDLARTLGGRLFQPASTQQYFRKR